MTDNYNNKELFIVHKHFHLEGDTPLKLQQGMDQYAELETSVFNRATWEDV